jgi:hypothetical protein
MKDAQPHLVIDGELQRAMMSVVVLPGICLGLQQAVMNLS